MSRGLAAIVGAVLCAAWAGMADAQPGPGGPDGRRPTMSFKDLDANGDGRLTAEEFSAEQNQLIERRFGRLDRNNDKVLSPEEFEAARTAFENRARRHLGDESQRQGLPGMPHFDEVDVNGDDEVSLDEFSKAQQVSMSRRFGHMDENDDGALSELEFDEARARFRERMQQRGSNPGDRP
jgi:Ca2+-binding EF-hand superfamily protein